MIKIFDKPEMAARLFPHAKYPFEYFNPVQSSLLDCYNQNANFAIASKTGTGKTIIAEMLLSHEIRANGKKGIYVGPLKSLTQEKIDDWTDPKHHFSDLKISICTGDYQITKDRIKELDEADLIVITPEMLSSRIRNFKSEKSQFLHDIGIIIYDEFHLIVSKSRGNHLEVSVMKFTEINPNSRICVLSATLPNVENISEWLTKLNNKETYLLESNFRPIPLGIHYETYWDGNRNYDDNEQEKISSALEIIEHYPEDKFLVFAHTKRTGDLMKVALKRIGIDAEFHNADLTKEDRIKYEKKFKKDDKFRVLIATSTVAWGCNLPARRVTILGVHRGLEEVENYDIEQEIGRSGRLGLDPRGDAYILLPQGKFDEWVNRLKTPTPIISQLLGDVGGHYKTLAFHIVSEIHHGGVKNLEDIQHWFKRSLAHHQVNDLDENMVANVIDLLTKCGAIREEDGEFQTTAIGKISSYFYYSPFDVSDLRKNFNKLFESNSDNDYALAMALADTDTFRMGIASKAEQEEMAVFARRVDRIGNFKDPAIKVGCAYYNMLNGLTSPILGALMRSLRVDYARLNEVLIAIDGMASQWGKKDFFKKLQLRLTYGVQGDLVTLCQIPKVGKVRATQLWDAGIRSIKDVVDNLDKVKSILNVKEELFNEIINGAKNVR